MLPDAEDYSLPHDAEDYTVHVEPSGPNMARNNSADGLTFLGTFAAVLLLVFAVGSLSAIGAKKFRVWRPLSSLILLVSFVPALLDFKDVRDYLLGVMTSMPAATTQRIDQAVAEFATMTFWSAAVSLVVCALALWRLPWTVVIMPAVVSVVYFVFPYRRLERMIYGTYVTVDGLFHLLPIVATLLLCALASGWLWGRNPKNLLLVRSKV